jgi:catechol 2,3-dioxygenase-like lactoylglutathione lyase family enzyme
MIVGMHHSSIVVADMGKSLAFYRDELGLAVEMDFSISGEQISQLVGRPGAELRAVLLRPGDGPLVELLEYRNTEQHHYHPRNWDVGATHVSLVTNDIFADYEALLTKGVEFTSPPVAYGEGPLKGWLVTYMKDPDGYTVSLQQLAQLG